MKYRTNHIIGLLLVVIALQILRAPDQSEFFNTIALMCLAIGPGLILGSAAHWFFVGRKVRSATKWLVIRSDVRASPTIGPGDIVFRYTFVYADTMGQALDLGAAQLIAKVKVPANCVANDIAIRIK